MKKFKYLLVFCLLYTAAATRAQTYVTSPMTGTPAPGLYYNDKSIAVNANFTFTPASGQSLQLYIITTGTYLDLGFVQQENVRVAGITNDSLLNTLNDVQKQTTRSYLDGTGRVLQTIGLKASPLQNDLVQPFAYDNLGRQTISYLPYAGQSTDTSGRYRPIAIQADQPGFYSNTSQFLVATDASPFTQQIFENSPLQRMLKAGTVGTDFQPLVGQHFKTVNYRSNAAGDGNIPIWNADGTFTSGNYYPVNTLSVTDAIDEDNTETLGFTDQAGHLILKRQVLAAGNLDTYYIYNWAGMLSYIVPPKAIAIMGGTYTLSATGVSKLIFHFVYDTMGRLIEKTVPAKGKMNIVYDPLNRPVLMQDSNMHAANKWNYIKYDVKGRAISQGIYVDATHTTRATMQSFVSGLNYSTAWFESRSHLDNTTGYYTNTIFPTTGTPLAYAYLDDYDLQQTGSANYSYGSKGLPNEETPTTAFVKDVPTMVWKTTVGAGLSGVWLLKVTFYDKRGNAIQTQSNNHVNYAGSATVTDTATTVPDFAGVPQITKVSKKTSVSVTTTVQSNIFYDHMYRVTAIDQYYNGSATVKHVAAYSYNELGQLIKKSLGYNTTTSAWIQNVDMRYNIRGQLLTINNSKLANDGGVTSGDSNDLFGIQMLYDKADGNLGNTPYYNGKLSAVKWMSKDASGTSSYERAFRYYYDQLNRDTAAIYAERTTASTTAFTTTNGWNENRITYDPNGNLLTLFRDSTSQGSGGHTPIDNLTYTYDTNNPNQLQKVTDGTGAAFTNSGFRNRTGSTSSYTYDGNGNLTNEPYKGLSAITYDVLNRTDKITFTSSSRFIDYTYDAGGTLIRKRQYDNSGALQNTTDYIDGFVYTTVSSTQTLQYFAMPEGRVLNAAGTLTQEYTIADQQGNVRITFDNSGTGGAAKVRQENSYYAFGLVMPGSTVTTPANPNKYLYNGGSEWQNDYGNLPDYYQTFNRNYDAALGRFIGADPASESAESMSSYQYAGNNPIMYNDPLGDMQKQAGANDFQWHGEMDGGPGAYDDFNDLVNKENALEAIYESGWYAGIDNGTGGAVENIYNAGGNGNPSSGSLQKAVETLSDWNVAHGGQPMNVNRFDNYIADNGNVLHQSAYASENGGTYNYRASSSQLGGQTIYTGAGEIDDANQGRGATVYIETDGLGHAYIEVNNTIFSFGRYAGGSSPSSGSLDPVGPGIMLKKTHQFAEDRMKRFPTTVYHFPNANANNIYQYLNGIYQNGVWMMTGKEGVGKGVGTYTLWGNNCTIMTTLGLQAGGVNIPTIVSPSGFVQYMANPMEYNLPTH